MKTKPFTAQQFTTAFNTQLGEKVAQVLEDVKNKDFYQLADGFQIVYHNVKNKAPTYALLHKDTNEYLEVTEDRIVEILAYEAINNLFK